jgi:hypothetical protein
MGHADIKTTMRYRGGGAGGYAASRSMVLAAAHTVVKMYL